MKQPYSLWVAVSVATIVLVVAVFYITLRNNKKGDDTTPSSSPTVTVSPSPSISLSPSPTIQPTTTPSNSGPVDHGQKGDEAYKSGNYAQAIAEYKLAIAVTTDNKGLASLWNRLGNSYRDNKEPSQAIAAYDKALSYDPLAGDTYLNKAALLWSQNKKEEAKSVLRTGIDKGATRKQDLQNTLDVYEVMS